MRDEQLNTYLNEDYLADIESYVKLRIDLFNNYAIRTDKNGNITRIYRSASFADEMEHILEDAFLSINKLEYQEELKTLNAFEHTMRTRAKESMDMGIAIPLEFLFEIYSVNEFERFCVMMALSVELNREYEQIFIYIQNDSNKTYPTLDLCIKMYTLDEQEQKKCLTNSVYRKSEFQKLFCMDETNESTFISSPLKLQNRIIRYILSFDSEDTDVKAIAKYLTLTDAKQYIGKQDSARQIKKVLQGRDRNRQSIFYLYGLENCGKVEQLYQIVQETKVTIMLLDMERLLTYEEGLNLLQRIGQEAFIRRAWLAVEHFEVFLEQKINEPGEITRFFQELSRLSSVLFLLGDKKWNYSEFTSQIDFYSVELTEACLSERCSMWQYYLQQEHLGDEVDERLLAERFTYHQIMIKECVKDAHVMALTEADGRITEEMLYRACHNQMQHNLGKLAVNIEARYAWQDLILPPRQKELLRQACSRVDLKNKVYQEWDFKSKMAYGRGISMLFYGPPGTGKTMGAQVIANRLKMELYQVEASAVTSKYIGETQKNLEAIFEEVKKSQSILFFDEADAIFGKRSEVKDSHDRYANADTAYLLQRIEQYEGIIILATNLLQNFDEAFKRRFTYMVEFPFPDQQQRLHIWEHVLPGKLPKEEPLDFKFMADTFELSGASIKNIALAAAFRAADEQKSLSMEHLIKATMYEYIKMGKSLDRKKLGIYQFLDLD